tara:strand:+ start:831 stop:1553 length:723 start_codon:yes stop_codon:yes gene_type:complete
LKRGCSDGCAGPVAIGSGTEFNVDLDFVVLESNERKGKTRVAAEPEFKRNVKVNFRDGSTVGISGGDLGKAGDVANHVSVANFVAGGLGEFVPDVHPVTIVFVNALATNFNFSVFDENVAEPVEPAERFTVGKFNTGNSALEVDLVHKVTIAGDGACYTLTEVRGAIECLFDGFHGEVGVATVNGLEECDLRIASKVNILSAIGYELHKTTSHCINVCKKKNLDDLNLLFIQHVPFSMNN